MSNRKSATWQIGLAVGGSAAVVFLAVVCVVGVLAFSTTKSTGESSRVSASKKMTREEFRQKYIGKTKEEVIKELGRPKKTNDIGRESAWDYGRFTYDPVSGKDDNSTTIWIGVNGRVTYIRFD